MSAQEKLAKEATRQLEHMNVDNQYPDTINQNFEQPAKKPKLGLVDYADDNESEKYDSKSKGIFANYQSYQASGAFTANPQTGELHPYARGFTNPKQITNPDAVVNSSALNAKVKSVENFCESAYSLTPQERKQIENQCKTLSIFLFYFHFS